MAVNKNLEQIKEMIPHRDPMLLIEEVIDLVSGEAAIGIKNLSEDEPYFKGHFPGHPVQPGVLIIEAMAQTAAVLVVETRGGDVAGNVVYFTGIENAKFKNTVHPGDKLELHVEVTKNRGMLYKFKGVAKVGDKICAESSFSAMIMGKAEGK